MKIVKQLEARVYELDNQNKVSIKSYLPYDLKLSHCLLYFVNENCFQISDCLTKTFSMLYCMYHMCHM